MVIADHTSDEDLPDLRGTSAAFEYIVRPRLLERKYTDYYYPRQTWDWNASSRLPTRTTAQQTSKTVSAFVRTISKAESHMSESFLIGVPV
jgi:hypothetical protein